MPLPVRQGTCLFNMPLTVSQSVWWLCNYPAAPGFPRPVLALASTMHTTSSHHSGNCGWIGADCSTSIRAPRCCWGPSSFFVLLLPACSHHRCCWWCLVPAALRPGGHGPAGRANRSSVSALNFSGRFMCPVLFYAMCSHFCFCCML